MKRPGGDELLPVALLLELRHPAELAVARHRREQPRRLGVRGHVALREDRRALRVEAGREEQRREVERALAQVGRVVVDRDRVQVDDAEERPPPRRAPAWPRTGGSRPSSCRSASRPSAGCRRRSACRASLARRRSDARSAAVAASRRPYTERGGRRFDLVPVVLAGSRGAPAAGVARRRARSTTARRAQAARAAAARLRRRGAPGAGGARRGGGRAGVPAPGGRLRRVVPRLRRG